MSRTPNSKEKTRLLFIGGWGRSGSTLLANLLSLHGELANFGEIRYLWDRGILENKRCGCGKGVNECPFWEQVLRQQEPSDPYSRSNAIKMCNQLGSKAVYKQLRALIGGNVRSYQESIALELGQLSNLYNSLAKVSGCSIVVDASKTAPYAINFLDTDRYELNFVHLVRDPRAVAYSWSKTKQTGDKAGEEFPKYSALKSSIYWNIFNYLAVKYRRVPNAKYLLTNYDSLCIDTERELDRIFKFISVEATASEVLGASLAPSVQHSISGNPMRFGFSAANIKPDDAWKSNLATTKKICTTVLCWPLHRYLKSILQRCMR